MRILLTLKYDGTDYCGWQYQDNGPTVQAALERALASVFGERVITIASSRTDAGVHAACQRVAFSVAACKIPPEKLCYVINKRLPHDIVAQKAERVDERFNPRFAAREKTYAYLIWNARFPDPLQARYAWHVAYKLNLEAMAHACECLIGRHDFRAFCAAGGSAVTFERTVFACGIEKKGDLLTLGIRGDGFLYNMVRIIAGTIVDVGRGRLRAEDIPQIIAGRDRARAGQTAPAKGLRLEWVEF